MSNQYRLQLELYSSPGTALKPTCMYQLADTEPPVEVARNSKTTAKGVDSMMMIDLNC